MGEYWTYIRPVDPMMVGTHDKIQLNLKIIVHYNKLY